MEQQMIISIGREFGSGGHEIGKKLSEIYNIPMYDHDLLRNVADERNLDHAALVEYDEKKRNMLLTRTVKGMTNSPAYHVANLQFDYIRRKAEAGESFIVIGRCSEEILKDYPCMISIFILGDMDNKVKRIMELHQMSEKEAAALIQEKDKRRKKYHNSHCPTKWGDSRSYDFSINSSRLGIDGTVKILKEYIDSRRQ